MEPHNISVINMQVGANPHRSAVHSILFTDRIRDDGGDSAQRLQKTFEVACLNLSGHSLTDALQIADVIN